MPASVCLFTECSYMRVCYCTNWSQYRPAHARFTPSNIDATLCTHILYAFLDIDGSSKTIVYREWNDYGKHTDLVPPVSPCGGDM